MATESVALGVTVDPGLTIVLSLAGLATAVLAGLGLAVFLRRRSRPYLLIALAFVTLFARTAISAAVLMGVLSDSPHHLLEHVLDTTMAALVVGAVYYARSVDGARHTTGGRPDD